MLVLSRLEGPLVDIMWSELEQSTLLKLPLGLSLNLGSLLRWGDPKWSKMVLFVELLLSVDLGKLPELGLECLTGEWS